MAHPADQGDVFLDGTASADEFFVYKFERRTAGLAGLSFDEGAFGVFGYVTKVGCLTSFFAVWLVFTVWRWGRGRNDLFVTETVLVGSWWGHALFYFR